MTKKILTGLGIAVALLLTGCSGGPVDNSQGGGSDVNLTIDNITVSTSSASRTTKNITLSANPVSTISVSPIYMSLSLAGSGKSHFKLVKTGDGKYELKFDSTAGEIAPGSYDLDIIAHVGSTTKLTYKVRYVIADQYPDLVILSGKMFDADGNEITSDNPIQAGRNKSILIRLAVKNVGKKEIPALEKYYFSLNTSSTNLNLPDLQNLQPGQKTTLEINTTKTFYSSGNNTSFPVGINTSNQQGDANVTFEESNTSNNYYQLKSYVALTDFQVVGLKVKIYDAKNGTIVRSDNIIDISEDKNDSYRIRYSFKFRNAGENHFYEFPSGRSITLKTGVDDIGNYSLSLPSPYYIDLDANTTSDEYWIDVKFPETLQASSPTYQVSMQDVKDTDSSNNSASIDYTIQE